MSPQCSRPLCLISDDFSPLLITSCTDQTTSTCHGSSSSSTTSDSVTPPHKPILCRPWPSTRSLSSLLLCPPSFGDPVLSYPSTLEHIPSRPRTLLRQQSTRGSARGARGSSVGAAASRYRGGGAGGQSRGNPGSWDYMTDQMKNRGLDVKSFL
ncbi:hypothetical protein XENOCAPTIV_019557 [Xenoophorus captivus]|uniref:Uncharacterized protein n=1 Tax=Xenoophorus captivus TaxID=1517983 RepID=A0ABV0RV85_9TELE